MPSTCHIIVAVLGLGGAAVGRSPLTSTAQTAVPPMSAEEIVRRSAEAIGGIARLRAIAAVRVEERGLEFLIGTPSEPRGPRRFAVQLLTSLRREAPPAVRRTLTQTVAMRPDSFTQTTIADANAAAVVRPGVMAPGAVFDRESAAEEVALAPERVLLTALAAPALRLDRDSTIGDTRYHIVSFPLADGRVQLAINVGTGFPERLRLVRSYPDFVFWAMWGQVAIETSWSSWSLESTGVWYPRQRSVTFNGEPFREYIVTGLDFMPTAPADSFAIPDSIASRFATTTAAKPAAPVLTPVSLADGIVLFRGGYQSALVRSSGGLIVVEAPESDVKSRAVLAEAARMFPGVPISAVITTSPMWMHIGGLAVYARRRIPIYALDVNGDEIRRLVSAGLTDHAQRSFALAHVTFIGDVVTLGRGDTRMELIPAHGVHGAAMMLVYWPAHQLLYASDIIIPPTFEPTFTRAYQADLEQVIKRLALPVSTVYSVHLPPLSWPPTALP